MKLKVNLFNGGLENFYDVVHELRHELDRHGQVVSHMDNAHVAQFTFETALTREELVTILQSAGFDRGLTVNPYDDEVEMSS